MYYHCINYITIRVGPYVCIFLFSYVRPSIWNMHEVLLTYCYSNNNLINYAFVCLFKGIKYRRINCQISGFKISISGIRPDIWPILSRHTNDLSLAYRETLLILHKAYRHRNNRCNRTFILSCKNLISKCRHKILLLLYCYCKLVTKPYIKFETIVN